MILLHPLISPTNLYSRNVHLDSISIAGNSGAAGQYPRKNSATNVLEWGAVPSLTVPNCTNSQKLTGDGSILSCSTDIDTDELANLTCEDEQVPERSGSNWICGDKTSSASTQTTEYNLFFTGTALNTLLLLDESTGEGELVGSATGFAANESLSGSSV